ncbi:dihydrolipoyllysine-residue acetyltransferase component 4 of pyruvate dehydrogenase complex, chloroplastic [Syzygium oleosum]|uniref:dihydrolipoyllysine-residue acetyltransferase component 4 of pyruvate dehydrogenase complex, chloroplastic n=1 Tax=Syzygium oleosum TaxID=219896 RepID=UPI0011D1F427|nr:dihydrolipoyllysine-residue acetyltransferase component 4 of pyruvate dehydrogenase complex, chloroplastic [Syzygium oleosum]XP_056164299.1 dihydrolipoyllysine-residue acetyltransferase component 4 of pyruvate dehydrogenase complex, chloroplastic [Syzygium oleosum]
MASSSLLSPSSSTAANPAASISFSSSLSAAPLPRRPSSAFPRGGRRGRRSLSVQSKIREIFMPALSSTMTEGKIVSWVKSEGDVLSKGESVVVVESDKADMDVETFYDGILAAIVVPEGESAPVGSPIGLLAETEDEVAEAKAKAAAKSGSPSSPPPAPPAAETPAVTSNPAPAIAQPPPQPAAPVGVPGQIVATPSAKKLAKQHKVDINKVTGTGPYGRITPADVEAAAGIQPSFKPAVAVTASPAVAAEPAPAAAAAPPKSAAPAPPPLPGSTVVPFTTMQAAVSKNMLESLSVPTFRVGYPVTTDALDALYLKVKPKGVTMTAILAKAAAMALVQHPVVNASCKDGKSFTYNSNVNIAVAVAINGGLITPVLQDADKLDLYLLSQKWKELVEKARSKQLQPHEYNSGTFTLSNLGMFGVDRFDAILPPGQGAIMAVGASKPTVVADADGFFSVKSKMLVNVTADHRIVYGADLAAFLQTFSKIVENPESLTL